MEKSLLFKPRQAHANLTRVFWDARDDIEGSADATAHSELFTQYMDAYIATFTSNVPTYGSGQLTPQSADADDIEMSGIGISWDGSEESWPSVVQQSLEADRVPKDAIKWPSIHVEFPYHGGASKDISLGDVPLTWPYRKENNEIVHVRNGWIDILGEIDADYVRFAGSSQNNIRIPGPPGSSTEAASDAFRVLPGALVPIGSHFLSGAPS